MWQGEERKNTMKRGALEKILLFRILTDNPTHCTALLTRKLYSNPGHVNATNVNVNVIPF